MSWSSIRTIYEAQFGVHMDPQTAYQRCHELQYNGFGSVQGLLEAMREYQRMTPSKLSDANLKSILWNKVPYAMQQEVGKIKEWSLDELFQRLLKAESQVLEQERRQQGATNNAGLTEDSAKKLSSNKQARITSNNQTPRNLTCRQNPTRGAVEAKLKCFNCHKFGYKVSACTKQPNSNRRPTTNVLTLGDNDTTSDDFWSLMLSVDGEDKLENTKLIGPTYKIEIIGVTLSKPYTSETFVLLTIHKKNYGELTMIR